MTALALVDDARITVTYKVVSTSGTIRRLTKVHGVTGELASRLVAEAAAACCGACRFAIFAVMLACLAAFCPGCT